MNWHLRPPVAMALLDSATARATGVTKRQVGKRQVFLAWFSKLSERNFTVWLLIFDFGAPAC